MLSSKTSAARWVWLGPLFAAIALQAAQLEGSKSSADFLVKFWRREHGLPGNSIRAIAQTQDGYLWVGTANGLVRFDGIRFTSVKFENLPPAADDITALAAAKDGSLWVGNAQGDLVLWMQGRARKVAPETRESSAIRSLFALESGGVLIGTDRGLFRFEKGGFVPIGDKSIGPVRAFCQDHEGTVWAGTSTGLWRISTNGLVSAAPRGVDISALASAADGTIWMAGKGVGLLELGRSAPAPRRVWPVSEVSTFCRSRSGEMWLATSGGTLEKLALGSREAAEIPLPVMSIQCLFEDSEGSLWVGSDGFGLAQVRAKALKIISPAGGSSPGVLSVTESSDGQIWFATEAGQVYRMTDGIPAPVTIPGASARFYVETLAARRSGGLWLGSRLDGLHFWSGPGTGMEKLSDTTGITALYEDRRGRLWIASAGAGLQLSEEGKVRQITGANAQPFQDVTCFAEDQDGGMWMGTRRSGIIEWKDDAIQRQGSHNALKSARINCLQFDRDGNLWTGTDEGLFVRRDGTFLQAISPGLEVVHQVAEDLRGNLWVASNHGIQRISLAKLEPLSPGKVALQALPLPGDEGFRDLAVVDRGQPTVARSAQGKLWFATKRGLAVLDTNRSTAEQATSAVSIEEVRVDNATAFDARDLSGNRPVQVPVGYRHLTVRFTAPTFISPEERKFRFRLVGVDGDWVHAGQSRTATYGRVPAGQYRFEAAVQNNDGSWPYGTAAVLLRIAPRYWETAWFKGLLVMGIFALGALFWLQQIARERELNGLRHQITRDLHDDLGSNVGSIALLSEALQKSGATPDEARQDLLQEINRIAHQTLDAMRDAVWFVDPEKDTSASLASHMRQLAGSMFKGFPHQFRLPEKLENRAIPLEFKRSILLIYKEALHNVLRHSSASQVDILLEVDKGVFAFRVCDNGSGFDPDSTRGGHGLKNMRHRAEKIGARLNIASAPGRGTEISLRAKLP